MSVSYRSQVAHRNAGRAIQLEVARPAVNHTARGLAGSAIGAALGIVLGSAAAQLAPVVETSIFMAMGALFGAFNGGLFALISHPGWLAHDIVD